MIIAAYEGKLEQMSALFGGGSKTGKGKATPFSKMTPEAVAAVLNRAARPKGA